MGRMKPRAESAVALFDVYYEDGTRSSNRKVPDSEVAGPGGDDGARTFLMDQDRKIAERSGLAPRAIKRIARSGR
jgi:hypothetical protein